MTEPSDETHRVDVKEFDRRLDERILLHGSRSDQRCPQCGDVGFRRVADSEMVALYACRKCGFQREIPHESTPGVDQPFHEYREGRGFSAGIPDEETDSE